MIGHSFERNLLQFCTRTPPRIFDMYYKPLWDWVLDQLRDRSLVPYTHWDARKLFKFDGNKWIRFIHEPYTANRWWKIQVCTPPDSCSCKVDGLVFTDMNNCDSTVTATTRWEASVSNFVCRQDTPLVLRYC